MNEQILVNKLTTHGLRVTKQRLQLAALIFTDSQRHVNAEMLHQEAQIAGYKISLATVYNTLNHFKQAQLLNEVYVHQNLSFFDTNTSHHLHIYHEDTGMIRDIDIDHQMNIEWNKHIEQYLDDPTQIVGMNLVIRVKA